MPIILEFTFEDGTTEVQRIPAEIWRRNTEEVSKVFIFNKTWKQWGTRYTESDDAIRVKVMTGKSASATEKMTFTINKSGIVSLMWGEVQVDFKVE